MLSVNNKQKAATLGLGSEGVEGGRVGDYKETGGSEVETAMKKMKLVKPVRTAKLSYKKSNARVRVSRDEGQYFPVKVGLRKGCVMLPWLLNTCMDGVVRWNTSQGEGTRGMYGIWLKQKTRG